MFDLRTLEERNELTSRESAFLFMGEAATSSELFNRAGNLSQSLRLAIAAPNLAEEDRLREELQRIERAAERTVDFAVYWVTRRNFGWLQKQVFFLGGVIVAGIVVFSRHRTRSRGRSR